MTSSRVLPLLLILTACSAEDRRPAPAAKAAPTVTDGTQQDLGHELDDAERRGTWTEVRHRWQGQRLRWTVTRHRSLCRIAEACNVAAFPVQRPAPHGWMPRVEFAAGEFARLEATCGDQLACEFTFEATLAQLDVSGEFATKLAFTDARIVEPRVAHR